MGNDGAMRYIKNGGTMERPNDCPDSIHSLMRHCWAKCPEDRPTFIDICQQLLPQANQRYAVGNLGSITTELLYNLTISHFSHTSF